MSTTEVYNSGTSTESDATVTTETVPVENTTKNVESTTTVTELDTTTSGSDDQSFPIPIVVGAAVGGVVLVVIIIIIVILYRKKMLKCGYKTPAQRVRRPSMMPHPDEPDVILTPLDVESGNSVQLRNISSSQKREVSRHSIPPSWDKRRDIDGVVYYTNPAEPNIYYIHVEKPSAKSRNSVQLRNISSSQKREVSGYSIPPSWDKRRDIDGVVYYTNPTEPNIYYIEKPSAKSRNSVQLRNISSSQKREVSRHSIPPSWDKRRDVDGIVYYTNPAEQNIYYIEKPQSREPKVKFGDYEEEREDYMDMTKKARTLPHDQRSVQVPPQNNPKIQRGKSEPSNSKATYENLPLKKEELDKEVKVAPPNKCDAKKPDYINVPNTTEKHPKPPPIPTKPKRDLPNDLHTSEQDFSKIIRDNKPDNSRRKRKVTMDCETLNFNENVDSSQEQPVYGNITDQQESHHSTSSQGEKVCTNNNPEDEQENYENLQIILEQRSEQNSATSPSHNPMEDEEVY